MKQEFFKGDVAMCDDRFKVRILDAVQDDHGDWWYTVTPTDWTPIGIVNREVPQRVLAKI